MILVKIKKFPNIEGLDHLSTTWILAKDKECTDIILKKEHDPSKDLFYSEATIPPEYKYYLKAIRHFTDPSVELPTEVIELVGKAKNNADTVLLLEDVHFERPTVYLDGTEFETSEVLNIKCSHPRANMEVHDYTTWFIVDNENNVLFSSVEDKRNKLNITVNNDPIYKSKAGIKILCIHGSNLGIESPVGKLEFINTESNYTITTPLTGLKAYTDNVIEFQSVDKSKPIGIYSIKLFNTTDNRTIKTYNKVTNSITIPWTTCMPNVSIGMEIMYINNIGKISSETKLLDFKSKYTSDIKDPDYKYTKTVQALTVNAQSYVPDNCIVESTFDNITVIPSLLKAKSGSNFVVNLIKHRVDNTKGLIPEATNNVLTTIQELNTTNTIKEGTLVKVLNGDMLLIDKLNEDNKPTFILLQRAINYTTPTYLSILYTVRDDETKSLGFTGGIIQEDNSNMLYIPVGTNQINRLNLVTGKVSKVTDIYADETKTSVLPKGNLTMLKLHNRNSVLIVGNTAETTVIYNYDQDTFEQGVFVTPISYVNTPLKVLPLVNGDMLVVKGTLPATDSGTQSHALYYKLGSSNFEELRNVRFSSTDNKYPSTWVLCSDGKLACLINKEGTSTAEASNLDNRVHTTTYFK
ncbi:hypothetical protein ACVWU4_001037 [Campylobacter coli]